MDVSVKTLEITTEFVGVNCHQVLLDQSKSVVKLGMSSVVLHLHSSPTS